jgi:hypothetical protein
LFNSLVRLKLIGYNSRHFTATNIDVSQKSATERKKLLDSGEVETSVELKFEEAKSVAQLWEALLNYDAVYSHLHPLDYGPKVLMRVVVHGCYINSLLISKKITFIFLVLFDSKKLTLNFLALWKSKRLEGGE